MRFVEKDMADIKRVTASIVIHRIQADIILGMQNGTIDPSKDSLREIGKKIKDPKCSPQQIKHHLDQLVKLGVLAIEDTKYKFKNHPNR